MKRKMELQINGAFNGYLCQSCKNVKENLSFLQKELLAKSVYKVITRDSNRNSKLTIKFKLKPVSLSLSRNCSVQKEEEMENKEINMSIKSTNSSKCKKIM